MSSDFGSIKENSLFSVVKLKDFKQVWNINKDSITICKVGQFRYICTDCRAYLEDQYAKPFKCNYDPYLNKWN